MRKILRYMVFSVVICSVPASVIAQGSLTPSGPPVQSMKSLDQIEPRRDVLKLPSDGLGSYVISQPGSYYLSTNLIGQPTMAGIEITTNNVTIDLKGFTLTGNATSRAAIFAGASIRHVRVFNGILEKWGTGVDFYAIGYVTNGVIEDLQITGSGVSGSYGIEAGEGTEIRRCKVSGFTNNDGGGIYLDNRGIVEQCQLVNNYAGIQALYDSLITDCLVQGSAGNGISAGNSCIVRHTQVTACGTGIECYDGTFLLENSCAHCTNSGIYANGSGRIEGNFIQFSGYGVQTSSDTTNFVARNVAQGSSSGNFVFTGTVVGGPTSFGTGTITNHAWANFSY